MKYLLGISFIIGSLNCFGQYETLITAPSFNEVHFQNKPYGFLMSLAAPPPNVQGSFYVHDEWNNADLFMTDSTKLLNLNIKIDLRTNNIEIEYNKEIKILPGNRVVAVKMRRADGVEEYINGTTLGGVENLYKNQFLQVLHPDTVMLLCKFYHEIIRGTTTPNPAIQIGKQDDKIILKKTYVIVKGEAAIASDLSKAKFKAEMISAFGNDVEPLLDHTNIRKEKDLTELVVKLNQWL